MMVLSLMDRYPGHIQEAACTKVPQTDKPRMMAFALRLTPEHKIPDLVWPSPALARFRFENIKPYGCEVVMSIPYSRVVEVNVGKLPITRAMRRLIKQHTNIVSP